jgi:hypothetical protein
MHRTVPANYQDGYVAGIPDKCIVHSGEGDHHVGASRDQLSIPGPDTTVRCKLSGEEDGILSDCIYGGTKRIDVECLHLVSCIS